MEFLDTFLSSFSPLSINASTEDTWIRFWTKVPKGKLYGVASLSYFFRKVVPLPRFGHAHINRKTIS